MKIRRYKGTNREDLYRMIHKEMGPDAVVVAPDPSPGLRFGGMRRHELIAILDEPSAPESPVAPGSKPDSTAVTENLQRWRRQQTRQWQDLQSSLSSLRQTVESLHERPAVSADENAARPAHARLWDSRFCAWAREHKPDLLCADAARVARALPSALPVAPDFAFRASQGGPHAVVLVGPTGSGKTTTLAKLAAVCALQEKLRVGMITTDTYRVAAIDQIREYASLLDAELRVAFSSEEARAAAAAMADRDVILVDTPGRTHWDKMGLAACRNVLRGLGPITVLLTLPATLNRTDLPDVLHGFSRLDPSRLIITKVDETRQPALFTSLPFETDLKVAFVTNGQRVPQDIGAAHPDRVAALLTAVSAGVEPVPETVIPVPAHQALPA